MTTPTIDGHAIQAATGWSGNTTPAAGQQIALTTTSAKDLIICVVAVEVTATPHATVSSISGLSGWTKRSSVYLDNVAGPFGTTWNTLEIWSTTSATAISAVTIVPTISKAADTGMYALFGVKYDGVSFPVWSSNASLPSTTTATGTSIPSVGSISTNAAALMIAAVMNAAQTAQTAGTGYAILDQNNDGAGAVATALATEDQAFATAQSGITVPFGTSWQTWSLIVDAIEAPSGGAPAAVLWSQSCM